MTTMNAPTSTIRVIAQARARQGQIDTLLEHALTLVAPTRAEAGNISYELLQDSEDSDQLIFIEEWADRARFAEHLASDHLQRYAAATQDLLDGDLKIQVCTVLSP